MAPETPKGISSRLLTMKFMQRAAASNGSTPGSESEGPSTKKRKLGRDSPLGHLSAEIDKASVQAALDEREAKRQAALEQHASNDTHWVLDSKWQRKAVAENRSKPLDIVYVGYGDIDSSDETPDNPRQGRTSTKKVKLNEPKKSSSSDVSGTDDDTDESSDDNETPSRKRDGQFSSDSPSAKSRQRSERRSSSKQRAESSNAKQFRDKRKKKEVQLNKLTSISSGGDGQFGGKSSQSGKPMTCYSCHQPGHRAQDCPKKG